MSLENYEGTAIDTSEFQTVEDTEPEVQSEVEPTETEEVVETVEPQAEEITTQESEESVPDELDIPGIGKLTVDEIKEMRQGSLRQSDYTRKTQELARQREELQDASELFNYLRTNPHLIQAMKEAENNPNPAMFNRVTPEAEMIQKLAYNQKSLEVDMKLSELKSKYGDVDEIELFKKATDLQTDDLEFVYKSLQYDKSHVDKEALIAQAKAELKAELEASKESVSSMVGTKQTKPVQTTSPLTATQKRIAEAMGMTENEYRQWM